MDPKTLWTARKEAALSVINQLHRERQQLTDHAKRSVVYMDGCRTPDDAHPAIAIVEAAHFRMSASDGMYHARQQAQLEEAALEIEAMTYEEN